MSATATRSRTADPTPKARVVESEKPESLSQSGLSNETANLAYALWERRGRPDGSADVDWFEAERQLTQGSEK
jgi:Protein of unknown function (DUF2934)